MPIEDIAHPVGHANTRTTEKVQQGAAAGVDQGRLHDGRD
jgi:hypothetical protein